MRVDLWWLDKQVRLFTTDYTAQNNTNVSAANIGYGVEAIWRALVQ